MTVTILAVTDEVDPRIYSSTLHERMNDVDFVISCGDLPTSYLEFISDALRRDLYYVFGNHYEEVQKEDHQRVPKHPLGGIDIGFRVVRDKRTGTIIAGIPGSQRYSDAPYMQFTEREMTRRVMFMLPRLMWNKLRYGRAFDILVTHSPPRDINDGPDEAHRGFEIIRKLINWFQPNYHLHGHVHLYDRSAGNTTTVEGTEVINVFPYQRLVLELSHPVTCPGAEAQPDTTAGLGGDASPVENR